MPKHNYSFWLTPKGLAAISLTVAVSYFLLIEHREHLFALLPYLIILSCPLMHLFMHKGHSHNHSNTQAPFKKDSNENSAYQKGYNDGLKAGKGTENNKDDNDAT
ncbi:DUF2933 domain-containing protein [Zooshikella sp. RANM57]|uniref:DUF2933 domain-containing protein n=1 Tax=Zooshikella sp. RANM57 TaxID=3425863 RepID=UPI003D6FDEED